MSVFEICLTLCFGLAAAAPFVPGSARAKGAVLSLAPLISFVLILLAGPGVSSSRPWAPSLGVNLDFRLDPLSYAFALLVTGIGFLVVLYAGSYMEGEEGAGRFFSSLLAFMGAMLGLVTTDNILLLFVFWELTSVTSYLLISFKSHKPKARKAALTALVITGAGGFAMLAGLLMVGMSQAPPGAPLQASLSTILQGPPPSTLALCLIALGCFTKSAQFPFHGWLPGAMEAPSPVSAYLHSATMVKAGVYLLAKLQPLGSQVELWTPLVAGVGAATLAAGGILCFFAVDLKRILAFSTIASLGALVMAAGLPGAAGAKAFASFLIAHALYKAALFMAAGLADHATGVRDIRLLGGLGREIPIAGAASALAALSMMGIFPLMGFVGKEYLLGAVLPYPWLLGAALIGAAGSVFAAFQAGVRPWWLGQGEKVHHKPDASLQAGIVVCALGGVVLVLPSLLPLVSALAASLAPGAKTDLKLWAGINTELLLSLASLGVGLTAAAAWPKWRGFQDKAVEIPWGPTALWPALLEGMAKGSAWAAQKLEHGRLRWDFMTYWLAAAGAIALSLVLLPYPGLPPFTDLRFHEALVLGVGVAGAVGSLFMRSRLAAIALLGALGFAIAGTFLFLGAPDLAITQVLVDILVVVFLVVIFASLPRFGQISKPQTKARDGVVALFVGTIFALLTLKVLTVEHLPAVSQEMLAQSVEKAKGANVVNTILVDFRALDTLGEITVLVMAALGVMALQRLRREEDS